ncbi:MAG: type VI secretion system baseplate subunit TssK [bacterium]|nr:type VI secretion system baseplate subunit TssK [bacterium]
MSGTDRVVWDEGMLLVPQHFQQWSRFLEAEMRRRAAIALPFASGLGSLDVDPTAVEAGEFAVTRLQGVLPSGFQFDAPSPDPLPAPRRFADLFDPKMERLGVHLAMPTLRSGGLAISDDGVDGNRPTPFLRRLTRTVDEARPGVERPIATAVPNLQIRFEGEVLDDYDTLQIAAVERTETGAFRVADSFVPTCLRISAAPALLGILRRTLEILAARSEELASRQRQMSGMAGAANLWLLHTLNSNLPGLTHLHHHGRAHPEQLFLELSRLAGQLCTFTDSEHPRRLPAYDHGDLTATFGELEKRLRALLETVIPHRCVPVALNKVSDTMFQGSLPDATLVEQSEFFVAVAAEVPEDRLLAEFPLKAKVSSIDRVQQLLMMAVPGLTLRHVSSPPQEIPVQPGRSYFRLDPTGEHWDAIVQSHSFAFHVPPDLTGVQLELMAIKK